MSDWIFKVMGRFKNMLALNSCGSLFLERGEPYSIDSKEWRGKMNGD